MVAIGGIIRGLTQVLTKHSPAILTGFGVVGVVGTTVLAVKATSDAKDDLHREALRRSDVITSFHPEQFTKKDVLQIVWRRYIPVAISGGITIVCIVGAQSINAKRIAALVSIYTLSEQTLQDYQDATQKVLGDKKESQIREEVAKKRFEGHEFAPAPDGYVTFVDAITGREFTSTIESVKHAENEVNIELINHMYAKHNLFYQELGLFEVAAGEELGWNTDHKMDLFLTPVNHNGKPVFLIDYRRLPIRDYERLWS